MAAATIGNVIEQFSDPLDGDVAQWNAMRNFINAQDLAVPAQLRGSRRRLDLTILWNYLLVNIYPATKDCRGTTGAPRANARRTAIFRFYIWDAEVSFGDWIAGPSHNVFTDQFERDRRDRDAL